MLDGSAPATSVWGQTPVAVDPDIKAVLLGTGAMPADTDPAAMSFDGARPDDTHLVGESSMRQRMANAAPQPGYQMQFAHQSTQHGTMPNLYGVDAANYANAMMMPEAQPRSSLSSSSAVETDSRPSTSASYMNGDASAWDVPDATDDRMYGYCAGYGARQAPMRTTAPMSYGAPMQATAMAGSAMPYGPTYGAPPMNVPYAPYAVSDASTDTARATPLYESPASNAGKSAPEGKEQMQKARPFPCTYCLRAFSRKHDLERHARVHSGDRPYVCQACKKGFPRSDALRRHMRVDRCSNEEPAVSDRRSASPAPKRESDNQHEAARARSNS